MGLDLLKHSKAHVLRAAQEGIVAALTFGFKIMRGMGMDLQTVKAGHANMFLSPLFRQTFVEMNQVSLELYATDGAQGAARGAGIGLEIFKDEEHAFKGLDLLETLEPSSSQSEAYEAVYSQWLQRLTQLNSALT